MWRLNSSRISKHTKYLNNSQKTPVYIIALYFLFSSQIYLVFVCYICVTLYVFLSST